jgi:hypothetical protein
MNMGDAFDDELRLLLSDAKNEDDRIRLLSLIGIGDDDADPLYNLLGTKPKLEDQFAFLDGSIIVSMRKKKCPPAYRNVYIDYDSEIHSQMKLLSSVIKMKCSTFY